MSGLADRLIDIAARGDGIRVDRTDGSVVMGTLVDWRTTHDLLPLWVAVEAAGAKRIIPWASIVEITIP